MATKLQCEICGGKLIGKPGGIFECENCGTEYSTEWAKAKIQEITGTVKVEGTVEVTGKVQIDGPVKVEGGANKEALLQRGQMALEERKWDDAKDFFNQALNFDAKCGEAYLGLAMGEAECRNRDEYAALYVKAVSQLRLFQEKQIQRAGSFDPKIAQWLVQLNEQGEKADLEHFRAAEEERAAKERAEEKDRAEREKAKLFLPSVRERIAPAQAMIAAGDGWSLGVNINGTVVAAGSNKDKQCDVGAWTGITALSANENRSVGLKSNNTVVGAGSLNISPWPLPWNDINGVAAGNGGVVFLKKDGTVIATGSRVPNTFETKYWKNIVSVSASDFMVAGLKADGTVVALNGNFFQKNSVKEWKDIVSISAGADHLVGLKSDGTVLAEGEPAYLNPNKKREWLDVGDWRNIVAVSAGWYYTVGLKADGTVVATGKNECGQCNVGDWRDIVAVSAGYNHTLGLKADGSVVAVGDNKYGQCNVSSWRIRSLDVIHEEYIAKKTALEKERESLTAELPSIKGLFARSKKTKNEARLAEIEAELKKLG